MRLQIIAAILLVSASNGSGPMIQARHAAETGDCIVATLDSLRDRYRPLLVFAPTDQDLKFLKQAQGLAEAAGQLHERQVVFVPLSYKQEARSSGTRLYGLKLVELSGDGAARARRHFGVAPADFTVILIGKDGGEKFRAHTPVTIEKLNALIDAMPMRQQEVRDGNSK